MIYWLFGVLVFLLTAFVVYRAWRLPANPKIHWIDGTKRKRK